VTANTVILSGVEGYDPLPDYFLNVHKDLSDFDVIENCSLEVMDCITKRLPKTFQE
jgi:hypothetical protein